MKYTVAIAGSTGHTVQCAEALLQDERFTLSWVLTPAPKPIGRKQVITSNPLHSFAVENQIDVVVVDQRIDHSIHQSIESLPQPDFLLVVDFGYLIPPWLLQHAHVAPLNIHPSLLPRWRGSSPGQYVLLYGEKESAVTLIVMDEGLDTGPLVHQEYFDVQEHWTQEEYYRSSFDLMTKVLGDKMIALTDKQITPKAQPKDSPTPLTGRFEKQDGFVEWKLLEAAINGKVDQKHIGQTSNLLQGVSKSLSWPEALANASRALNPWPTLWTIIPTTKGEKRMQILHSKVSAQGKLELQDVKIEGQSAAKWNTVKNIVQ